MPPVVPSFPGPRRSPLRVLKGRIGTGGEGKVKGCDEVTKLMDEKDAEGSCRFYLHSTASLLWLMDEKLKKKKKRPENKNGKE